MLAGLAQGINQGLGSYVDARKSAQEMALRKRQAQLTAAQAGYDLDPETGDFKLNPLEETKRNYQQQQYAETPEFTQRVSNAARAAGIDQGLLPKSLSPMSFKGSPEEEMIKGAYSAKARQVTADRMGDRNSLMRDQFEERQNVNSTHAGMAFEKDPILVQTKKTNSSLDRATSLLNGKEPITAKSFAVLQQDFINAMAPGGAATEGKVNREMVETAAGHLNELALKFGNVADLRKAQPEIVNNLRNLINQVHEDYLKAQSQQAIDIHDSYSQSRNPLVLKQIQDKLKRYAPSEHAKRYGGATSGLLTPNQAPPPSNKPSTVIQNGHTYDLNPTTGEYE